MMKRFAQVSLVAAFAVLRCLPSLADAPYEKYHVEYKEISKDVLKNTIGILTLNHDAGKSGTELKTYKKSGDEFVFDRILQIVETTPISNFDWQPHDIKQRVLNCRYPIISIHDPYLCMVYDPRKNLKAWINKREAEQGFGLRVAMLDSVSVPEYLTVDIFTLTPDGRRTIFTAPEQGADSVILSLNLFSGRDLTIVNERNGFIQVEGPMRLARGFGYGTLHLKAWIRKRDDEGNLTIWLILISRD